MAKVPNWFMFDLADAIARLEALSDPTSEAQCTVEPVHKKAVAPYLSHVIPRLRNLLKHQVLELPSRGRRGDSCSTKGGSAIIRQILIEGGKRQLLPKDEQ